MEGSKEKSVVRRACLGPTIDPKRDTLAIQIRIEWTKDVGDA